MLAFKAATDPPSEFTLNVFFRGREARYLDSTPEMA
jgi:hypothetical protein